MDADGEGVREQLLRGFDVDVARDGSRRGVEMGVVRGQLATECVHAAGDLTRLLVAPADWREVGLVVHEAAVKGGLLVRVGRADVDLGGGLAAGRSVDRGHRTLPRLAGYSKYWNLRYSISGKA